MMVYILTKGEQGEGSRVLSVHDSMAKAKKAGNDFAGKYGTTLPNKWVSGKVDVADGDALCWMRELSYVDALEIVRLKVQ